MVPPAYMMPNQSKRRAPSASNHFVMRGGLFSCFDPDVLCAVASKARQLVETFTRGRTALTPRSATRLCSRFSGGVDLDGA